MSSFVYTDGLYFTTLNERLTQEKILAIIDFNKKSNIVSYFVLPVYLYLKFMIISGIIYIGGEFLDKKVSFSNCYRTVLISEIIPLFVAFIKAFYFLFHVPQNLFEIQQFYPLSIGFFFKFDQQTPAYLVYLAQQVNFFEILYWLILSLGISFLNKISLMQSLKIIISSYVLSLIIWILFIVFIQLQFS